MNKLRISILAFSIVGFGDSAFITFFESKALASCSVNISLISCENVLNSPYASIFGIPWSLLGMIWFLAFLLLSATKYDSFYAYLTFVVLGTSSIIYLLYLEFIVVGSICLYCTVAHICAIGIILSSIYLIRNSLLNKKELI